MNTDSPPRRRVIAYSVLATCLPLLLVELACRLGAFVYYGLNSYYLTYGFTSVGLAMTTNSLPFNGYFKFKPGTTVTQGPREDMRIPSSINDIGLRGLRDVHVEKPVGTIRIVSLGGSSTFGYHAHDDKTYPALLEQKLNATYDGSPQFEVINAGIPSFTTDNLIAILTAELLRYDPDVITIYAAYNDAIMILDTTRVQATSRWLYDHLALYVGLTRLMEKVFSIEIYSKWSKYSRAPTVEYVDRQIALHREHYGTNLQTLLNLGRESGASVVFVRQPMSTWAYLKLASERPDYDATVEQVRELLVSGNPLDWEQTTLLIQAALVETMTELARSNAVPVVDNVRLVDLRKDRLVSYVHLTEEGNDALASELALVISGLTKDGEETGLVSSSRSSRGDSRQAMKSPPAP